MEFLGLFINGLTVLEIVAAEFLSIWLLSRRKHRLSAVLGSYLGITAALLLFMVFVASGMQGYGNGSGRWMVLGILYFIPAMVHFGGDWKSRLIIAFFSFSYGLAVFAVSVRVGYLIPDTSLTYSVFFFQTLLYLVTFPFYLHYARRNIIPYIVKANRMQKNILIRYTIVSFLLIIVFNGTMTVDGTLQKKLLVYLLLIYFVVLSYRLMASYLKADDDKQELSEMVMKDRLTGLGNRMAFRERAGRLLEEGRPFYVLFMDLDQFKTVNDRFGHSTGDLYLNRFAQTLRLSGTEEDEFFRLSGDEFACLTKNGGMEEVFSDFTMEAVGEAAFLGLSVGQASYPEDGETMRELLEKADERMYAQKRGKDRISR